MRPRRVILHCSDTPDDSKVKYCAADIDAWHRARGFKRIGYHRVVGRSGLIEMGRDDLAQGAHVTGENFDSLGVCYIGRSQPTIEQVRSILKLYQEFKRNFAIGWSAWHPHYEYDPVKTCPGFPISSLRMLLANVDSTLANFDHYETVLDLGNFDDQIKIFLQVASFGDPRP